MEKIILRNTSELNIDWKNPRLAEFNFNKNSPLNDLYKVLWDEMALIEMVISITANGFFQTEPLLVTNEEGKWIVLEGNRRLSAVKVILEPDLVENKIPQFILEKITPELRGALTSLPVIELNNRKDSWRFVGFKHINGPAKWNSFAKAIYIADVHDSYTIPLTDIAYQVGDTHKTVQKLYQGIRIIEQAEDWKVFDREDISKRRLYFSHLYTALQYDGYKKYLNISSDDSESRYPVPKTQKKELGELLLWLFGSKKRDIEPIIVSQNPDLKRLESVLGNTEAVFALRRGDGLEQAYELSQPTSSVFIENLLTAKWHLQKAWANVTAGYTGDEEALKSAIELANQADKLYEEMKEIRNKQNGILRKSRSLTQD